MRIFHSSNIVSLLAVLALGSVMLVQLSCSPRESQLVGTWERSSGNDSVVITLHSDGTFVAQLENGVLGGAFVTHGNVSGTWRVKDDHLIARVTETTTGKAKVGHTWSDEIVDVSKTQLVLRPLSGDIEEYTRRNNE